MDYVETLVRKPETEFNVWPYYPFPLYDIYSNYMQCRDFNLQKSLWCFYLYQIRSLYWHDKVWQYNSSKLSCLAVLVVPPGALIFKIKTTKPPMHILNYCFLSSQCSVSHCRLLCFSWMELISRKRLFMFSMLGDCGWDFQKGRQWSPKNSIPRRCR